jgi:N-acyl-D-aspartate/D-glutamate deacylase
MWGWDNIAVMVADKNSHLIGKIISDLAQEQGRDAFDVAADIVIDDPDVYHSGGTMSEEEMKYAMKQDWLMFSSDGEAFPVVTEEDRPRRGHPRSFGSQARVLQRYVREEKVLPLEDGIRKMTSLPASFLQLKDRGILQKGYKADIAIFDPETIREHATYADARQYSTGVEYVIVNGKIGIEKGEYTGGLYGKLLLLTENK